MPDRPPPLVVVDDPEGATAWVVDAIAAAEADGWLAIRGWTVPPGRRVVCVGEIAGPADARRALLAALAGAGLVVTTSARRSVIDQFLDELRRLGPVAHVTAGAAPPTRLDGDGRALLDLLADGLTLGQAADELGLSRRTADRRLAGARRALGVATTPEAVLAFQRARSSSGPSG